MQQKALIEDFILIVEEIQFFFLLKSSTKLVKH